MVVDAIDFPLRGARVVADVLSSSGRSQVAKSSVRTVDFPTPDGPETMINLPFVESMSTSAQRHFQSLFHILDHLSHAFDNGFEFNHIPGNNQVTGL